MTVHDEPIVSHSGVKNSCKGRALSSTHAVLVLTLTNPGLSREGLFYFYTGST